MSSMRRPLAAVLLCLVVPATAAAAPERPFTVEKGRELYGVGPVPKQAAGVRVSPAEGIAARTQNVTLTLADASAGPVQIVLPDEFGARSQNGRSYVPGRPSGSRRLSAADRSASFDVSGLPAGTYDIPVRRGGRTIGTARSQKSLAANVRITAASHARSMKIPSTLDFRSAALSSTVADSRRRTSASAAS